MKKEKYKEGLTFFDTILTFLCISFFVIGGLLLRYDKPLIEENGKFQDRVESVISKEVKEIPEKKENVNK